MKIKKHNIPAIVDPSQICRALVGLKGIEILFYRRQGSFAEIAIQQTIGELFCKSCGSRAYVKDRPWVSYVDLPFGGTPTRVLWKKHRMICRNNDCETKTWTLGDHRISAVGCFLTTRAAKWATKQVGGGRSIREVAAELECDWKVINKAVLIYGEALLSADRKRLKTTTALGLDETLFLRTGKYKTKSWCTTVSDVGNNQLIDILPTREFVEVASWINTQPEHFRENLVYGALDMSPTYAAVYSVVLPKVIQVVDRFHLMRLANLALDTIRRRVQQEQLTPFGLNGRLLAVLVVADEHAPELQQRIGKRLDVDRTTMVALIDSLQAAGFVERRNEPNDRRGRLVHVSSKGRRAISEGLEASARVESSFLTPRSTRRSKTVIVATCISIFIYYDNAHLKVNQCAKS